MSKKAVIVAISSDIGMALADHWLSLNWQVYGTYRTPFSWLSQKKERLSLYPCDLLDASSIQSTATSIADDGKSWDVLVLASGVLSPVGLFHEVDFSEWERGIQANLLGPLAFLHRLLPHRNVENGKVPTVLFFAGGGTNQAVLNYSSYTLSKIALIKMVELLDAELPDTRFVIVGPGWVKTKIHEQTFQAGEKAGANLEKAKSKYRTGDFVPMEQVVACCHWLVTTPSKGVHGRNISTAFDGWGTQELETALEEDPDMYKLRRHKNTDLVS